MTISIVVNSHAEGPLINFAIKSVDLAVLTLQRTFRIEVEKIIVLDNPDDETSNEVNKLSNTWARIFVDNGDLGASRNAGVNRAQGKYVAFLDGDDLWGKSWLLNCWNYIQNHNFDKVILHPEVNYYFGFQDNTPVDNAFLSVSSNSANFSFYDLASTNYWTALAFSTREAFIKNPYKDLSELDGISYEDWQFNIETLALGYEHLYVKDTAHFIRTKNHGSMLQESNRTGSVFNSWEWPNT